MNFFKVFLASLLAVIAAGLIGLFVLIGGIGAIASSGSEPSLPSNAILYLKMDMEVVDHYSSEPLPFAGADLPFGNMNKIGLYELVNKINQARDDDRIKGIYLETVGQAPAGWSSLQTIREALGEFRAKGKFIYTWAPVYNEATYYLASVADSVFMPTEGDMEFNGLGLNPYFVLGLLEKLDIKPRIFRVGEFKSAGEMFTRKDLSPENREQVTAYLNTFWQVFLQEVSESRSIPKQTLDQMAETFVTGSGRDALAVGLVDRLVDETEVGFSLREKIGIGQDAQIPWVTYDSWFKVPEKVKSTSTDKIAVIFAEGDIVGGKGGDDQIGMETFTGLLRKVRKDKSIKAVVLRINSGGGDALASELIANEVRRTNAEKPVVVSMGDVAASGGYYIAMPSRRVFAHENTITGSIGVIGLQFGTAGFFTGKMGISFDEVTTHSHANLGNPNKELTEADRAIIQKQVERVYGRFLQVVRDGRQFKDTLEVDRLARGRVWSGKDALDRHLVDEIGTLEDAISYAAKEAGIKDYRMLSYPKKLNPLERILADFTQTRMSLSVDDPLYTEWQYLRKIRSAFPGSGMYTRIEWMPEIR